MIADFLHGIASYIQTAVDDFLVEILVTVLVATFVAYIAKRRSRQIRSAEKREAERQSQVLQDFGRNYLTSLESIAPGTCRVTPSIELSCISDIPEMFKDEDDGQALVGCASSRLDSTLAHGAVTLVRNCVVPDLLAELSPSLRDAIVITIAEDFVNKQCPEANHTFMDEVIHPAIDENPRLRNLIERVRRICLCAHTFRTFLRLLRQIARSLSDQAQRQVAYVVVCLNWLLNAPGSGLRKISIGRMKIVFVILPFWLHLRPENLRQRYRELYRRFSADGYQWIFLWCKASPIPSPNNLEIFRQVLMTDTLFASRSYADIKTGLLRGARSSVFLATVRV